MAEYIITGSDSKGQRAGGAYLATSAAAAAAAAWRDWTAIAAPQLH